jgi:transposase
VPRLPDWKPVYYLLEDAVGGQLLNAAHMRNVPGRKTDVSDAAWIARLVEHGLVRASFVPPAPIRRLRDLTRYRAALVGERSREKQRMEKLLEDAGIKLSVFVSDVFGSLGGRCSPRLWTGNATRGSWPAWRRAGCGRRSLCWWRR